MDRTLVVLMWIDKSGSSTKDNMMFKKKLWYVPSKMLDVLCISLVLYDWGILRTL